MTSWWEKRASDSHLVVRLRFAGYLIGLAIVLASMLASLYFGLGGATWGPWP